MFKNKWNVTNVLHRDLCIVFNFVMLFGQKHAIFVSMRNVTLRHLFFFLSKINSNIKFSIQVFASYDYDGFLKILQSNSYTFYSIYLKLNVLIFTITVMQFRCKFQVALEFSHSTNCRFVSRHNCWMVRLSNSWIYM